jgi:hypothetical protein
MRRPDNDGLETCLPVSDISPSSLLIRSPTTLAIVADNKWLDNSFSSSKSSSSVANVRHASSSSNRPDRNKPEDAISAP